jgi:hypothetical protein
MGGKLTRKIGTKKQELVMLQEHNFKPSSLSEALFPHILSTMVLPNPPPLPHQILIAIYMRFSCLPPWQLVHIKGTSKNPRS